MPLPYQNVNITYYVKFTYKRNYIENEEDNSIALKESNGLVPELINEIDYNQLYMLKWLYTIGTPRSQMSISFIEV